MSSLCNSWAGGLTIWGGLPRDLGSVAKVACNRSIGTLIGYEQINNQREMIGINVGTDSNISNLNLWADQSMINGNPEYDRLPP